MDFEIKTLNYRDKIVFEKVKVRSFQRLPKLYRANEACFMFVESGDLVIRTPKEVLVFEKNDGFLAKCINYFIENNQDEDQPLELIGVLLYPDIVRELFPYKSSKKINNSYNINRVIVGSLLMSFKESIKLLIENPALADEELIKNKLIEFILLISKTVNSTSELDFLTNIFSPAEYDFKTTIEANIYSDLSLNELAHLCNMSRSTFNRKFEIIFKDSPKNYVTNRKLEKACNLLKMTNNRIADIAFDCGFESTSTFNRAFQKQLEISPTQYRNGRE
ncbi:helix-turn-helix domain-containing protein [Flavivirga algicola]|uniref:Helix-turn-helix transcriptional regulator n=1 Tax=Flavivirga algicola TaxID=2729136 RepID=A0ABX1S281_9FLAO|nr:helix-turn-helix domain-containing protein [Flavivirga algicola]NMH89013.1 helix-turn-helix transcriptional regulator [Flavivirga algicola]